MKLKKAIIKTVAVALAVGIASSAYAATRPITSSSASAASRTNIPSFSPINVGTPHEVSGHLHIFSSCQNWAPSNGWKVKLIETYHIFNGTDFTVPAYGSELKTISGVELSPRMVTETNIGIDGGEFLLEFREIIEDDRVPYQSKVFYTTASGTKKVDVYRFLKVAVQGDSYVYSELTPVPMISFFGDETYKYVGDIQLDNCFHMGG